MIVIDKIYFGPADERRQVIAIDDGMVAFRWPTSGLTGAVAADAFETWRLQSERRTYLGADGLRRTRLRMYDSEPMAEDEEPRPLVDYLELDGDDPHTILTAEAAAWAAWRETAA